MDLAVAQEVSVTQQPRREIAALAPGLETVVAEEAPAHP
jgi:predicted SpoU family rRNA methylase